MEQFAELLDQEILDFEKKVTTDLVGRIVAMQLTISTAESVTGGLIAEMITRVPGSSDCFIGGIICYNPRIKIQEVGVKAESIRRFGSVSALVAEELVVGIANKFKTTLAISVTGVAGPGIIDNAPVGLVFCGLYVKGKTHVHRMMLEGTRVEIRKKAALGALHYLGERLEKQ